MNEQQYRRLKFLKSYLEQLELLKRVKGITPDDYRSELEWLGDRITELEDEVFPEVKTIRESPEMKSMRKSAETFFDYTERMRHGK